MKHLIFTLLSLALGASLSAEEPRGTPADNATKPIKLEKRLVHLIDCKRFGKEGPTLMEMVARSGYGHVQIGLDLADHIKLENRGGKKLGHLFNMERNFLGVKRTVIDILDEQKSTSKNTRIIANYNRLRKKLVELGALTSKELAEKAKKDD